MTPDQVRSAAAITGLASLVAGVAVMHWPSALCVGGVALLVLAIIGETRSSK